MTQPTNTEAQLSVAIWLVALANPVVAMPNSTDGGTSSTDSVTRYAAALAHSFSSSGTCHAPGCRTTASSRG